MKRIRGTFIPIPELLLRPVAQRPRGAVRRIRVYFARETEIEFKLNGSKGIG